MINLNEAIETLRMIRQDNLDVRTVTVGISLLDCAASSVDEICTRIRKKITETAGRLAVTADDISREFGIPIVNKRDKTMPQAILIRVLSLSLAPMCWPAIMEKPLAMPSIKDKTNATTLLVAPTAANASAPIV